VVVARPVPEFEVVQTVAVEGEVVYPGFYPITRQIRRVYDLLIASGGVTNEAFPAGAVLYRQQGNVGQVVLELDEILMNPKAPNNISLLPGDRLIVPKAKELVSIRLDATRANEQYQDSIVSRGKVAIAYQGPQSAKWYIENYAGGFSEKADRKSVTVREPSGRLRRTSSVLGIKVYPKVKSGSTIALRMKEEKVKRRREEPTDWVGIATAITTALMAGLAVVVIVTR
jgi:Periplasmic protein involved in polysaccharide export